MKDLRSEAEAIYPFRATSGLDHKAWAKRIIYREERGDTLLMSVQITDARMALGLIPMPPGAPA